MKQGETLQIYEADKAMIDTQIATAKAYPRNIKQFVENCVTTVTLDLEIAKSCIYTVPRGGKKLTGESINLAKILMQYYGNFRAASRVVDESAKHVTVEAVAFDLESNVSYKCETKRLIVGKDGRFSDDMITITTNAAMSIALRKAILSVIPQPLIDKVYNAAKKKVTGDLSSEDKLIARRTTMINGFKQNYGVTEKEILYSIGKESVAHIGEGEIIALIGIETAIKEGGTTVDKAFRGRYDDAPKIIITQEDALIKTLKNCENIKQLQVFKTKLKTNEHRAMYDEMISKFNKTELDKTEAK